MDDTGAVLPLTDLSFAFHFIATHAPPKGLNLSTTKCELLLATNNNNPLPHLNPQLAQELQAVADKYCKGNINTDGLILLGVPIGSGYFIHNFLIKKLQDFERTLDSISLHVLSPATKMCIFQGSLQHRAHFHQFVDGAHFAQLELDHGDQASHYIDTLQTLYKTFLANLSKTHPDDFPNLSWQIATLPLQSGGLGIMDPSDWKTVSYLHPLLQTITSAHHGVILNLPKRDTHTTNTRTASTQHHTTIPEP